jgi:CubicO group peptidase (beta-lactamase class C family)
LSRIRSISSAAALAITSIASSCSSADVAAPANSLTEFEQQVENLRAQSHIAGITAVIVKGQSTAWVKSFGLADVSTQLPTADSTVYHLASLTKPFASTVILQLVQEGKVSLDDPVSDYGINLQSPGIVRVRHLMSHTSEGQPGTNFIYNGDRFALLDAVIQRGAGKPFAAALQERILAPLALRNTAPNPQSSSFAVSGLDRTAFEKNMARGYAYSGSYIPVAYPSSFGAAAGLTASAVDVARFSMAMDRDAFLSPATKALAYAPTVTAVGDTLPYALGWFATRYKGVRVVWHYGLWTAISSLIIKVPERGLTFVVLANSEELSRQYQLGAGKLESSPWARAFLDAFVIGSTPLP